MYVCVKYVICDDTIPSLYENPSKILLDCAVYITDQYNLLFLRKMLSGELAVLQLFVRIHTQEQSYLFMRAIFDEYCRRLNGENITHMLGNIMVQVDENIRFNSHSEYFLTKIVCSVDIYKPRQKKRSYSPVLADECMSWIQKLYNVNFKSQMNCYSLYPKSTFCTINKLECSSYYRRTEELSNLRMVGMIVKWHHLLDIQSYKSDSSMVKYFINNDLRRLTLRQFLTARHVIPATDRLFCNGDESAQRVLYILEIVWSHIMKSHALQMFAIKL